MTVWELKSIDEMAFVGRGRSRHRPRNHASLFGGKYPFVQTADIHASDLYIRTYSQTYSDVGLAQSKLWSPGTICITNAGENTGDCAILGIEACFPDSIIAVISDPQKSNSIFLKYAIDMLKPTLRGVTKGATQDNLSLEKLLSFKFPVPPIDLQNKIGFAIELFGQLIECNRQKITALENVAQTLFREWFLEFRFPGHENVQKIDSGHSEFGMIPVGWRVTELSNCCELYRENVQPQKQPQTTFNHYSLPAYDEGMKPVRDLGSDIKSNKYLLKPKTILFPKLNPRIPRVWRVDQPAELSICSSEFLPLSCGQDLDFLFSTLKDKKFLEACITESDGTSNSHQRLKPDAFMKKLVVVPDAIVKKRFTDIVRPIFEQIDVTRSKNHLLAETRALLVPKLLTGEIDISSLESSLLKEQGIIMESNDSERIRL